MATNRTIDGTEICHKDWGTGPPIVFSDGWPLSSDDWDIQMLFFLQHGYRVIAHDRRGHGRSTQTGDGHDTRPGPRREPTTTASSPSPRPGSRLQHIPSRKVLHDNDGRPGVSLDGAGVKGVKENYKKNAKHSTAIVAHKVFPGRDHYTCGEDGWEAVADLALDWALDPWPGELD